MAGQPAEGRQAAELLGEASGDVHEGAFLADAETTSRGEHDAEDLVGGEWLGVSVEW